MAKPRRRMMPKGAPWRIALVKDRWVFQSAGKGEPDQTAPSMTVLLWLILEELKKFPGEKLEELEDD